MLLCFSFEFLVLPIFCAVIRRNKDEYIYTPLSFTIVSDTETQTNYLRH